MLGPKGAQEKYETNPSNLYKFLKNKKKIENVMAM